MRREIIDPEASRQRARRGAAKAVLDRLRLPPRLTLSEWADQCRILSRESSSEPGPWRTDRVPYLREIMDTVSGSEFQDLTIVKCSQSAGTEVLNNAIGYFIDQEPSPLLMIQPNVKPMAEAWSKDRLAPMLRDSPRLQGKVRDPAARSSGNTVLHKTFPGGHITIIGANSPAGLASRPIRVVLCDELDRWPSSAGTEGDPLALAEARTTTFRHRRKVIKVSTPGNEGESRIEREWRASDQRQFYVPCPSCGHEQPLEWRDSAGKPDIVQGKGKFRLVWEKAGDGEQEVHRPETAAYQCRACEALIQETHKPAMLAAGKWIKHNPTSRRAGWFISGLLSPWVRWRDIAAKWLKAKTDDEERKAFFNTVLGLLYQSEGEVPDSTSLKGRREQYAAEVPAGVGALTAAIDVQGDRLELEVRGWGHKEESWQIRLERILGDPEQDEEVWSRAEEILLRPWVREDGTPLRVVVAMVDSGFLTDVVYRWVKPRQGRRVFAYKGVEDAKVPVQKASRANRDGVKVVSVNPTALKDVLFRRLARKFAGPGYLHFGQLEQTGAPDDYFDQFGAEKREVRFVRNRPVISYTNPNKKRNEAIDLYVMNLAGLRMMGLAFSQGLDGAARPAGPAPTATGTDQDEAPESEQVEPAPAAPADTASTIGFSRNLRGGGFFRRRF